MPPAESLRAPVRVGGTSAPGGLSLSVISWPAAPPERSVPFVLVHGLASNARLWDGVSHRLAARGHVAHAVDLRGHGRSDKPDAGYGMATVADDVRALIDALALDRPVLVGQSWGANVVLETAARHADAVRGVVCVDGGFIDLGARFADFADCWKALAPPRFAGTPAATFEGWIRGAHPDWPEEGILGALANVEVRADATVAPWLTFERHEQVLHGLWEHRPDDRYAHVRCPVLWWIADSGEVAWSADKRAAAARATERLASSRVRELRADHDLHAQHPDVLAESLLDAVESGWMA